MRLTCSTLRNPHRLKVPSHCAKTSDTLYKSVRIIVLKCDQMYTTINHITKQNYVELNLNRINVIYLNA